MVFTRYSLVGALAAAAHYALLGWLVEWLHADPAWAAAAGATFGAGVAYAGNRKLTFTATMAPHRQALPRFLAVAALGVAISGAVVHAGTRIGLHYFAAQALATGLVLAIGFRLNRRWSFA